MIFGSPVSFSPWSPTQIDSMDPSAATTKLQTDGVMTDESTSRDRPASTNDSTTSSATQWSVHGPVHSGGPGDGLTEVGPAHSGPIHGSSDSAWNFSSISTTELALPSVREEMKTETFFGICLGRAYFWLTDWSLLLFEKSSYVSLLHLAWMCYIYWLTDCCTGKLKKNYGPNSLNKSLLLPLRIK